MTSHHSRVATPRTSRRPWLAWAVASALLASPAAAQLVCDGPAEGFGQGIPAGWTVVDGNGGGLLWSDLAGCGEVSNFTGGAGGAACASSDQHGLGAYDAELRSPLFDLPAGGEPVLRFDVSYQSFAGADRFDVDLSDDGGATWSTLLGLAGDHGVFRATPGETLLVDLSAFAGQSGLQIRFRYHDPEADAFDWYAQIDDVALVCAPACATPPVAVAIADPGFEAGTPSAAWTEISDAFSSPICTSAGCGITGAVSGDAWAFFGGSAAGAADALEQDLTLPFGIAELSFGLWVPAASGNGLDQLSVLIDGQQVAGFAEGDGRYRDGYRRIRIDVSPFADDGLHRLRFESATSGQPSHSSFFVDDVAIEVCTAVVANPEVTIDDVTLVEGNAGQKDAVFTVSLSGASRDVVTVDFSTADSSARVADGDYLARSGTLTFPRGSRIQTIAVPVTGDTVDEPTETFLVNLSGAQNAVLLDAQGLATITNDDFSFLSISSTAALEREGVSTEAVFAVTLSTPSSQTVIVDYASSDGTAVAGLDYQAVSGTLSFSPGTLRRTIVVTVFDDERVERDETFFVDLSGPLNAVIDSDRGNGKIIDNDRGRFPVEGTDVFYTETVDFELGRFLNTHTDVPDQVQLTRVKRTFPNIWVAASSRGTIVRVDTRTGTILGEYSSNPDAGSSGGPNPSRTTVALDGTVWAGNRGDGSVIHIGLPEENQCIDRNGNGTIETSSGYGDVLPWPNPGNVDSGGGVATAQDECILHYVKVSSSVTRHLSVDRDNNIWVSGLGGSNARVFDLVDGDSGQILRTEGPMPCGGYGGLVDANGVLWSAQYNSPVLRWDPSVSPPTSQSLRCVGGVASYGLAIDPDGDVWVAGPSRDRVWEISSDGQTVRGPFAHGSPAAQGLAADAAGDVWVSSAKWGGSATVGHLKNDGTFVGNVTGVPRGSSGVAVDIDGNVWTANAAASSLSRINPLLGPIGADGSTRIGQVDLEVVLPGSNPYNYSDMTGSLALASTSPRGTWQVIQDAGLAGTTWGTVTWNTEAEGTVPAGAALVVEARAADTEAGLGSQPFLEIASGVAFELTGRFIQVRATLRPDAGDLSPVLSDLRISASDPTGSTGFGLSIDNQTVFESDSGMLEALFTVSLSAPGDGSQIEVYYDVFEGSATADVDYTPVSFRAVFPAGVETQQISVTVFGDTDPEADETFFVKLRDPVGAAITDGTGVGTIVDDDLRLGPVVGDCVKYTLDEEFDLGRLFNANHEAPLSDQLQVNDEIKPFPFIWIAASGRGTIVKIDTRTGAVLGEYSTTPDNRTRHNPSRTTVALDGSAWVGNRSDGGSVLHVGLPELNQCVDRNGNGTIETSTGYGNILPWPNPGNVDSGGGVTTAQDECILHYVRVKPTVTRHVTLDRDNNVWISGYQGSFSGTFQLIDGQTGEILRTAGPFGCGGYGGFVDRNNVMWSSTQFGRVLRWDLTTNQTRCLTRSGFRVYGLGIGPDGWVWGSDATAARAWKISPDGNTILGPFSPYSAAQGLAVDENGDAWISSGWTSSRTYISHMKSDGSRIGRVNGVPAGSSGVAIDANGKIWTANWRSRTVARIDPTKGPIGADGVTPIGQVDLVVPLSGSEPYNYSDMTGAVALQGTAPRGTWRAIQDGGEEGTQWGVVTWNTEPEASVPDGASITAEARAADTLAGLGGKPFVQVENGLQFALAGRYIEVRATLRPNLAGISPVLSDIQICTADLDLPAVSIDDVTVTEGDPGGATVTAEFTVSLSQPSAEEVLVSFATVDGNAADGEDYTSRAGTLAFLPGITSLPLAVEVLADLLDEPDETFAVDLSFPRGATLGDGQGIGTILDDDPSVALTAVGVTVEEGDPLPEGSGTVSAVFQLTLDAPSNRTVRLDYQTVDGTAEVGVDYQEGFGYLEIPPGETSATITVLVLGDLDPEDDETFLLLLQNPDGAELLTPEAVGLILDDDLRELSIDDVTVEEGDAGTVVALFTVSLAPRESNREITVDYQSAAGTAEADVDYQETAGLLVIPAGDTEGTISVLVEGDLLLEADETFTVELSNPTEAIIVDGVGDGTILDDEVCPGPNLLANPSAELRAVGDPLPSWTPLPGTAWQRRFAPPEPVDGKVTFFPGAEAFAELWQDVDVSAFADRIDAGDQAFELEGFVRTFEETPADVAQIVVEYRDAGNQTALDAFDSGQISSLDVWQRVADVRAVPAGTRFLRLRMLATRFTDGDNDAYFDALTLRPLGTATVTVDDVTVYEGASGTTDATFHVRLSCPVDEPVTVDFTTADGSALVGADYLAVSGQLVFQPGDTVLPVPVPVVGDDVDEPTEVFHLDLTAVATDSPLVVTLDPRGDGTILDDDFCPRSPGFWKNHTEDWPVDYLVLGGVEYEAEALLDFLSYGGPDASLKLAHHLVATKLNLAAGSDPFILPTVEAADLFLVDFPPGSNPKGEDKQTALAIKDELDAYNNLDCEEGPVIAGSAGPAPGPPTKGLGPPTAETRLRPVPEAEPASAGPSVASKAKESSQNCGSSSSISTPTLETPLVWGRSPEHARRLVPRSRRSRDHSCHPSGGWPPDARIDAPEAIRRGSALEKRRRTYRRVL